MQGYHQQYPRSEVTLPRSLTLKGREDEWMSHWHRSLRAVSVKTPLLHSKLRFVVDHDLGVDLALYLPAGTLSFYSLGLDRRPSR